jgi:hypothetical protein
LNASPGQDSIASACFPRDRQLTDDCGMGINGRLELDLSDFSEQESDMRKLPWRKWAVMLTSGATLLQVTGCAEVSVVITAVATSVTAGGVIYLISRILTD